MSTPEKARDVHAAIREAAAEFRAAKRPGVRDASAFPEVAELLQACRDAMAAGLPRSVLFHGQTYWLRFMVGATLEVFDSPTAAEPLLTGASFSTDTHGHRPGH